MSEITNVELPRIIIEHLELLDKKKERVLNMAPLVGIANELICEFEEAIPGTNEWRVSIGYESGSLQGVLVHVNCLDLRKLIVVRQWLRKKGFPAPKTEDYAEIGRRSWCYHRQDQPTLILSGFVGSWWNKEETPEGQKCEFVKVGLKEPEPIYELRCDGEKLAEENT